MALTLNAVFQPFFPSSAFPALVFSRKKSLEAAPVLAWHESEALLLSLAFGLNTQF